MTVEWWTGTDTSWSIERERAVETVPRSVTEQNSFLLSLVGHLVKMSVFSYNGGVVVAMRGKDCVAIASDKRLGVKFETLALNFPKIFGKYRLYLLMKQNKNLIGWLLFLTEIGPQIFIGLPGLATDTITVFERLRFRVNLYELRENRRISPKTLASIVSNMLYEKRFGPYFVEPIVAGLDNKTGEPFIQAMDVIGCGQPSQDFVVSGTACEQAMGICETLWKPDMGPDELFETISQALMNAFDRDAISGWGGIVYILEKDKVTVKSLRTRMD